MSDAKQLPNGQFYFKRYKEHGMKAVPSRMPSKKQVKRWHRMIKRRHMTPESYLEWLQKKRWWRVRYSGQA